MTTLIIYETTGGTKRRCDARCHDAKGEKCECICVGANHGVGVKQAMVNTRNMAAGWIDASAKVNPDVYQIPLGLEPE